MNFRKLSLVLALAALTGAFLAFDLGRYLSLDYFKSQQAVIETYRAAHPGLTAGPGAPDPRTGVLVRAKP